MKIYIIRHGQSLANTVGGFCGATDVPLTELGLHQAEVTAKHLESVKIDAIFASPLSRAYSTAVPVASSHGLDIVTVDGLREMNYGSWERLHGNEVDERFNGGCTLWINEPWKVVCDNGESMLGFYDRAVSTLQKLASENPSNDICIATHGAWIKCILCHVKGLGPHGFTTVKYPANASVTTLEYNGTSLSLLEEDYCEHLGEHVTRIFR